MLSVLRKIIVSSMLIIFICLVGGNSAKAIKMVKVEASADFSAALCEDGTVWTWGVFGSTMERMEGTPQQVHGLNNVISISSYSSYLLALKEDGTVYKLTSNDNAQNPVKIESVQGLSNIKDIAAGSPNLALKQDGTVYSWGQGYMGNGGSSESSNAVKIQSISGAKEIATRMILKNDGTVWTWGDNGVGQLGDGTYDDKTVPLKVKNLYNVTTIASNGVRLFAVKSDGSVWAWGGSYLGSENIESSNVPIKINGLSNIKRFALGSYHCLALNQYGKVWAWGNNYYAATGIGNDSAIPVQLDISNIVDIAGGLRHSLALDSNGDVYSWGFSSLGATGEKDSSGRVIFADNTTMAKAYEIFVDTFSYTRGQILKQKEYRYYKFIPKVTTTYEFETVSNMDTYGYLYDNVGNQLAYNDDGNKKGESTNIRDFLIKYKLQKGKTYYIGVRAYSSTATGDYRMRVGYWDDYGNTIAKAHKIENYDSTEGEINYKGDVDVFKFSPSKDGIYSIEAISNFDSYGFLYDSEGAELTSNDDGNKKGESDNERDFYINYRLKANNTYYIKIKNYYSNNLEDIGNYTLKIKYYDDYDNEISQAYNIGNKETVSGEINYGGDVDMFKFIPPENGAYTIESQSEIDTYGYLYNASSTELSKNDDGNSAGISSNKRDFYIKYNLEAGKVYYIKVKAFSASITGQYKLKVRRCYSTVVENYYDQAFNVRYGFIGNCSDKIQETNKSVSRVFKKLLNLDINNNTPIYITSLADNCKLKRGYTISTSTIDQMCPGGVGHEPNCTGYGASFDEFYSKYNGNDTKVTVLWTGNAEYENGSIANRSFTCANGICIEELSSNKKYFELVAPTLAHELAHQIGAPDHYHEILGDGSCTGGDKCKTCNPNSGRPEYCLMNYCDIYDFTTRDIEKLFCPDCLNDIKNHLKLHH